MATEQCFFFFSHCSFQNKNVNLKLVGLTFKTYLIYLKVQGFGHAKQLSTIDNQYSHSWLCFYMTSIPSGQRSVIFSLSPSLSFQCVNILSDEIEIRWPFGCHSSGVGILRVPQPQDKHCQCQQESFSLYCHRGICQPPLCVDRQHSSYITEELSQNPHTLHCLHTSRFETPTIWKCQLISLKPFVLNNR